MNIINMTPHPVTICDNTGNIVRTFPSSGKTIRLSSKTVYTGEIDGIPITKTVFGEPEGLPPYKKGTFYIVSQLVKNGLTERDDLLVPAEVVRDSCGAIIGCKSLGE